jgi:NADH-ubiquinone oxidoreductase chain 6
VLNNIFLLSNLAIFISSILLVTHWDPIKKLISLIALFLFSTFIFLIFNFFFLGLTYLIVYIGAIAILFLFVIMMIPLDNWLPSQSQIDWSNKFKYVYYLTIFILASILAYAYKYISIENNMIYLSYAVSWTDAVYTTTDIEVLAHLLYIKWPIIIVLISYILWLILIGVLWVTLG